MVAPLTVKLAVEMESAELLRDGIPFEWSDGGEAYEYDATTGLVRSTLVTQSRDCDGRYDWCGESEWHISGPTQPCLNWVNSGADPVEMPEYPMPVWEAVGSHQRDYAAEAAGY